MLIGGIFMTMMFLSRIVMVTITYNYWMYVAHLNNFIILPDTYKNILAPIDFDLAYLKKEFININYEE